MKPVLLVLAAGMGSRYGGVKQIEPVGPSKEIILEYSIYDAIRSGFGKVMCVIRKDIERDFVEHILARFRDRIECEYVFQDSNDLPAGFLFPADRKKPWGTAHAVLAARKAISSPFAVINADDFYGKEAFEAAGTFLTTLSTEALDMCMIGYRLGNTVSEHGTVARGICEVDSYGHLRDVVEHTKIETTENGIVSRLPGGSDRFLTGNETVSMNFFGFSPAIFSEMEAQFAGFLAEAGTSSTAEFYIPTVVNHLLHRPDPPVLHVLRCPAEWFGITYREDKPRVVESVAALVEAGVYPANLWA